MWLDELFENLGLLNQQSSSAPDAAFRRLVLLVPTPYQSVGEEISAARHVRRLARTALRLSANGTLSNEEFRPLVIIQARSAAAFWWIFRKRYGA